jgi:hypothetical protein
MELKKKIIKHEFTMDLAPMHLCYVCAVSSLTTYHPCYLFITTGVCCLDARKEKKKLIAI